MKLQRLNEALLEGKKKKKESDFRQTLRKKFGITEFAAGNVGFSPKDQKWYGWSHRAVTGFKVGDKLFDETFKDATDTTPFQKYGEKDIKTLDDAKQAALNFARYVS